MCQAHPNVRQLLQNGGMKEALDAALAGSDQLHRSCGEQWNQLVLEGQGPPQPSPWPADDHTPNDSVCGTESLQVSSQQPEQVQSAAVETSKGGVLARLGFGSKRISTADTQVDGAVAANLPGTPEAAPDSTSGSSPLGSIGSEEELTAKKAATPTQAPTSAPAPKSSGRSRLSFRKLQTGFAKMMDTNPPLTPEEAK